MILTIIILSVFVVVLGFTTLNLLKKNEKCEDVIRSYESYMINLSNTIEFSDKKLLEILKTHLIDLLENSYCGLIEQL
jgi:hypothetical protein